jgi:hypothetical protein
VGRVVAGGAIFAAIHQAANLPHVPTQAEAAGRLNVGERTVRNARVVLDKGTPQLVKAVDPAPIIVRAASFMASTPTAFACSGR